MKKLNILIISENFLKGGLERHIINQYIGLKDKINFTFVFGNYLENEALKNSKIYNIKIGNKVNEFIESVDQLVEIIKTENIDIIHCHPFNSFLPAMFASQITKKPILYTIHGFASLNFFNSINQEILFKTFISCYNPSIISVSNDYLDILKYDFFSRYTYYLPNSVDTSIYEDIKLEKNNKWILISRLDIDKKGEIVKVIKNINSFGITLDIVGDGGCRNELEQLVAELKLKEKVKFLGYKLNIHKELKKGYNGVIGLGQVVLEGLSSNLPVLLIGYGKITGLVDEKLFEEIRNQNFVNRSCSQEIDLKEFKNININIKKYQLRLLVKKYYDINIINGDYNNVLNKINFTDFEQIRKIFSDIKELSQDNNEFANSILFESNIVYDILKRNLINIIINTSILNLFKIQDLKNNILIDNNKINKLENVINELNNKINQIKQNKIKNILKKYLIKLKRIIRNVISIKNKK